MTTQTKDKPENIRASVRQHYGKLAAEFKPQAPVSCCSPSATIPVDQVSLLYEAPEASTLPADVTGLSLGCGDPITLAALRPGQTVLDLGSGGGIDCFLAAQRVGESGHVIGVDMTAEMIEKARLNQSKLGASNVEFRLGEIEHLPVADSTVDVIISNCVINLSPDKPQVFREVFRVLRPGGRLAVSDMVTSGPLPEAIKNSMSAWAGCIAGALDVEDYIAAIEAAGFVNVQLTPLYMDKAMVDEAIQTIGLDVPENISEETLYKSVFSAKITADKS
jgi:ubiquinone/menaquinone biosynthesis C-methylase UbiE